MSHVDEGALHAYLDGALDEYPVAEATRIREHLDQCAECAEKLEVERSIRSDAHAVLAMAAPEVDLPSLEELRAYVKRTRPTRSAGSTRMVRMGWAASVALALGTGYVLRDGQLALQTPSMDAAMEAESVQMPASEPVNGPARDALEERVAAEDFAQPLDQSDAVGLESAASAPAVAEAEVAVGGRLRGEREALPAPGGASPDVLSGGGAGRLERAAPTETSVAQLANEAPVVPPPAPSDDVARFNDSVGDVVASADLAEEVVEERQGVEADLLTPAELIDSLQQAPPGVPANALADIGQVAGAVPATDSGAAAADPASDEDRASRRRSDSPVAVTSALEASAAGAAAAKAEDAELERLPATAVPGLELIEVSGIGEGTTFLGTHTMQRLEGGGVLNVFHLEPEVSPDVLPARAIGDNEASLESEEGWIIVRGPRSEAELQELLQRLLPEG